MDQNDCCFPCRAEQFNISNLTGAAIWKTTHTHIYLGILADGQGAGECRRRHIPWQLPCLPQLIKKKYCISEKKVYSWKQAEAVTFQLMVSVKVWLQRDPTMWRSANCQGCITAVQLFIMFYCCSHRTVYSECHLTDSVNDPYRRLISSLGFICAHSEATSLSGHCYIISYQEKSYLE